MEGEEGWGNKHKTNTDTGAEAKAAEGKGKRQLEKERIPGREQPSFSISLTLMLATKLKNLCTSGVTVPYAALQPRRKFLSILFDFSGMWMCVCMQPRMCVRSQDNCQESVLPMDLKIKVRMST